MGIESGYKIQTREHLGLRKLGVIGTTTRDEPFKVIAVFSGDSLVVVNNNNSGNKARDIKEKQSLT